MRFSGLGHPRRATLHEPGAGVAGEAGLGGVDLVPEPGSPAAAYEERLRRHPRRHAVLAALLGVAKVVVPILVALLLARLAFRLPLPDIDLPSIPRPDLPDLPLPDLPSPNLPDWSLPGWARWLLDKAKYVVPVLVAVGLAQGELKRRRDQDAKRAELEARSRRPADDPADDPDDRPDDRPEDRPDSG